MQRETATAEFHFLQQTVTPETQSHSTLIGSIITLKGKEEVEAE
jgi:hypothetical protein